MVRLERHIVHNNLHEATQSAYKKTETALFKISNDILCSLDIKQCIILASLDLSVAFDTVDHTIFIHKLRNEFGIGGKSLSWFTSYLHNRQHRVCVNGQPSESRRLDCGVSQGSVLGARMYTMYTQQLAHIIQTWLTSSQLYPLHQIYTHCMDKEEACSEAAAKIENCIFEICTWMKANALKIKEEQTEYIIFSKNKHEAHMTLLVGTQVVKLQETIKILGVTLDYEMS